MIWILCNMYFSVLFCFQLFTTNIFLTTLFFAFNMNKEINSEYGKKISPRSLPKMKFTTEDDEKLKKLVELHGTNSWKTIASKLNGRNPRQCKDRWENYLSPDINTSDFTQEEDLLLLTKQKEIGSKWVKMKEYFNNRTDAMLKNRWQLLMRRKLKSAKLFEKKQQSKRKYIVGQALHDKHSKENEVFDFTVVKQLDDPDLSFTMGIVDFFQEASSFSSPCDDFYDL